MARLVTAGFEVSAPDASGGPEGTNSGTTVPTRDTAVKRTGAAAAKCAGTVANTSRINWVVGSTAVGQTIWHRFYFACDALPASVASIEAIVVSAELAVARLTSGGKLQLWSGTAGANIQIGSDSVVTVSANGSTFYRIEMGVTFNSTTSFTAELRVDGATVATGTYSTLAQPTVSAWSLYAGWYGAPGLAANCWLDDVAVNDSTGAAQNSWPGAGKVVLLMPASDSARTGWTQGDTTTTTNLWSCIDNTPPVGVVGTVTGTIQVIDKAANTTDTYDANLTTYAAAGCAAGDALNAITLWANQAYSAAAAATLGCQLVSNPAISEFTFATIGSAGTTYPTNWAWGSKISSYSGTFTGNSVTVASAPVLRIRHGTSSSSRTQYVDAAAAYVDYTPAASGTTYTKAGFAKENG